MKIRWFVLSVLLFCLAPPLRSDQPGDKKEPAQPETKKAEGKQYQVPYRLTDTSHVLVRAKINGKGPYNFIVDTGAPLLFVATSVAKEIGIKEEKKGATLDTFELEGGAKLEKVKAVIDTPYQIEGMNALGLAGVELHGILGYTVLANFKMEFDFTKDKMTWTRLDFQPPPPIPLGVKDKGVENLDQLGTLMKGLAGLLGKKKLAEPEPRGFLGVELADAKEGVTVKAVFADGPAAKAGLKAGDRITSAQGKAVNNNEELLKQTAQVTAGQSVRITVARGDETKEITITAGEGL